MGLPQRNRPTRARLAYLRLDRGWSKVQSIIRYTSIIRTPLYYRQFVWSQKCQKYFIPYLYNTDTSVKRTLGSVPLVSVLYGGPEGSHMQIKNVAAN